MFMDQHVLTVLVCGHLWYGVYVMSLCKVFTFSALHCNVFAMFLQCFQSKTSEFAVSTRSCSVWFFNFCEFIPFCFQRISDAFYCVNMFLSKLPFCVGSLSRLAIGSMVAIVGVAVVGVCVGGWHCWAPVWASSARCD